MQSAAGTFTHWPKNPRSLLGSAMGWPITAPLLTYGHGNTDEPKELNVCQNYACILAVATHSKEVFILDMATFSLHYASDNDNVGQPDCKDLGIVTLSS